MPKTDYSPEKIPYFYDALRSLPKDLEFLCLKLDSLWFFFEKTLFESISHLKRLKYFGVYLNFLPIDKTFWEFFDQ